MSQAEIIPHPYEAAVKKLVDAVEGDKCLTVESIDKLTHQNDRRDSKQRFEAQLTVSISINSIGANDEKINPST